MTKGFAINNSMTNHGGIIQATQQRTSQMGNLFLRAGDGHFCPKCKCWSTIQASHNHFIMDGEPVAYVDDLLSCGAKILPKQDHVVGKVRGKHYNKNTNFSSFSAQGFTLFGSNIRMKQFVDLINTQPENSIQSLDTFGHGSDLGLYSVIGASLKRTLTKEEVTSNNLASNLYRNWNTKRKQWRLFGDSNWQNLFDISDINFKVFTNESKIEIHGCNTAFDGELDTLSSLISLALFKAGKKRSVVIGHADFSSPNRGGTKDITKQDYRHETRIIYNNGKVIAKTRREGRLSAEFIKKALEG
ncbi:hypothetical protein FQR65_LT16129 [Abscondita terminalis]|nr:hypothetical protein FQR65_LT16129 [Abscondita terminalis]